MFRITADKHTPIDINGVGKVVNEGVDHNIGVWIIDEELDEEEVHDDDEADDGKISSPSFLEVKGKRRETFLREMESNETPLIYFKRISFWYSTKSKKNFSEWKVTLLSLKRN